ncbi:YciI family protein [Dactylosporangium fulvum]|uniref:YciI family protein n=1 Tax=Dactylosporangium fulvum TaxID=53359 RepID=A0ABY5W6F0_9ACTN|nr:YciI family protein [Dactylosporangium fulvum]UWP84960.1 YciI family protein [Dactylosporangium fulvum]
MKYLLLVVGDGTEPADPDDADPTPWVDEMDGRGVRLLGERLADPADAVTVRVRDGEVLRIDGPFAETKEQIGGFDIIEAADLDEAIAIAAKHPVTRFGMIEVRPFWQP